MRNVRLALSVALVSCCTSACVQRRLTVTSDPPGALVYLNNQEFGRTPVTRDFTWYGNYDVQLRKEGYETLKTSAQVTAPWWQWPPIDLFAEFMPFQPTDVRSLHFTMKPADTGPADADKMLERAAQLQSELQSSQFTRGIDTK